MNEQHCAAQSILATHMAPAVSIDALHENFGSNYHPDPYFNCNLESDDQDDFWNMRAPTPVSCIYSTTVSSVTRVDDGESSSDNNLSKNGKHSRSEASSGSIVTSNNSNCGSGNESSSSGASSTPKTKGRNKRKKFTHGMPSDKRKKLARKAQLARASRQRQKQYITELEGDVKALQKKIADLQNVLEARKDLQELGKMASFGRAIFTTFQNACRSNGLDINRV